ncbi:hypothetical protein ABL78_8386 [Leptomonas seymouri]|uniref:Uncharacterized protein n=1 Tax=Leptomonas seymouri TaxID=5684 RepID=A0A0N1PAW2_LEPSE|nr:hypothetical protein ABL78_8386 [Leptomonas seymouri]|eukprot:KPI82604.1 hypothetical protein ABL78_8386 [Leptomonas seymouri]
MVPETLKNAPGSMWPSSHTLRAHEHRSALPSKVKVARLDTPKTPQCSLNESESHEHKAFKKGISASALVDRDGSKPHATVCAPEKSKRLLTPCHNARMADWTEALLKSRYIRFVHSPHNGCKTPVMQCVEGKVSGLCGNVAREASSGEGQRASRGNGLDV